RIEVAGATVPAEPFPKRLGHASGADGPVDIGGGPFCDSGQRLARRGLEGREVLACVRRDELAADEMPENCPVFLQPRPSLAVGLGSRAILHGLIVMRDAHGAFHPTG